VNIVSTITSDTDQTIKTLDGFYCANVVASLWADAVANRLEGPAIFLLTDELAEISAHGRAAAQQLADRIGDLGGTITADPRQLLDTAPRDSDFDSRTAATSALSPRPACVSWASSSARTRTSWRGSVTPTPSAINS
jgi:hypothetical protein